VRELLQRADVFVDREAGALASLAVLQAVESGEMLE
jgi:hypothetical protein